jgi:hypothetical protein
VSRVLSVPLAVAGGTNGMSNIYAKEKDLRLLLDQMTATFSSVRAPTSWKRVLTQKDFESFYMDDGFDLIRQHIYDFEDDEVHYLTPFMMRAYLDHYRENNLMDFNLTQYLFWFAGFQSEVDLIKDRYLSVYRRFSPEQRAAICSFLSFLVKHEMDDGFIDDDVVQFWCKDSAYQCDAEVNDCATRSAGGTDTSSQAR